MVYAGGDIEAILKLNATPFSRGLEDAVDSVDLFKRELLSIDKNSSRLANGINQLTNHLKTLRNELILIENLSTQIASFNKLANAIDKMSSGFVTLSKDIVDVERGINIITAIFTEFRNALEGTEVNVKGLSSALRSLSNDGARSSERINQMQHHLANMRNSYEASVGTLMRFARALNSEEASLLTVTNAMSQYSTGSTNVQKTTEQWSGRIIKNKAQLDELTASLTRNSEAMRRNGAEQLRNMGYTGRLSVENTKNTSSINKQTSATNKLTSATSRLNKAMSSLKMMGTMVGSMLAYNFAHNLMMATNETVQSKSEMEGYFKMLNYGSSEVDRFNKALDQTVSRFQRVNKYSLGETISSIGVEFNLTTDEMIKAMDVTSMITSEYLRAGRNANEASLAVKDVLQGQFQRLSRETGVKGEQLKEAGWNGDVTDVNSLLDALRKVGEDRNWDIFAEKANSLNDIVTILQNRFGEWSADMVNVVQPSIVNAFNSIMEFSQGVAQGLLSLWKWLNTDGWGQTAVKIGMVSSAILTLMPMLTAWRSGSNLLQVANMSLTQSLGALVFGLNAEALATSTTSDAIATKLLGITAEQLEETSLVGVINGMIASRTAEAGATALATESNLGFIGGLTAMITGETIAEGTTIGLTGALGLLTGAFLASPIGWFTLAILGLASAFYVLSGGLDSSWDEMKKFNETMQNAGEEQKKAQQYLADLKKEVGENSQAYKDAEKSVNNWKHELQSASYWMNDANKKFEEMNLRMSANSKPILRDMGLDENEIEKFDATLSHLTLGKNKYYKAEQVLNAQLYNEHSNYNEDLKEYLKNVEESGGDLEEAYEKMSGNYANLAEHSYIANTTDDWWEWMWNSLYAGMDQFWIDWDKFDLGKSLSETLKGLGDWINGVGDLWNDFWNNLDLAGAINNAWQGLSDWASGIDIIGSLMDLIFPKGVSASDGSSDHPEVADEMYQVIVQPIVDWWNGFMADPLAYIGNAMQYTGIGSLISALMGVTDGMDLSWAWEWLNNTVIIPLQTQMNMFLADPLSYIGGFATTFGIGGLINALIPNDGGVSILNWVNTAIIQPMTLGIQTGIASIPIIGDIAQMLGLVPQEHEDARTKGNGLGGALGNGLTTKIGQIPIVGDILRLLGLIPQTEPTANTNGQNLGDAIKTGFKNKVNGMAQIVRDEIGHIITAIQNKIGEVGDVASDLGNAVVSGVKNAIDPGSPGIIARSIIGNEFGIYIPQKIADGMDLAYSTAQSYGQQIKDGISSVNLNSFGSFATDYEADTQMINASTEMMGIDTTTAFNNMSMAVNTTTSQMGANVNSTYTSMQTKQQSSLQSMKQQNVSAYNDMYLKSNQSLIQMRDSTSNITHQMTNAWNTMKNNIVASANQLKHDSTVHFNTLSNTIGSFYRKIQNPSSWGAGTGSSRPVRTSRNPSIGRRVGHALHGAGAKGDKYRGSSTMTISQLKKQLCPNGDCANLFDGYSATDRVDVQAFLNSVTGEHGFGGWGDWHGTHYNYIKTKSDAWSMKSPTINLAGGIPTNADYKVGDFENGSPKISFGAFQSMAESIFSAIPYRHYMDSSWKGSWLGALQAGACNCSDGADALIAFAGACGFGGSKVHGTWDGEGHFWAVINGKPMDTTAWQKGYGWTSPKVHGYGMPKTRTAVPHDNYSSNNNNQAVNVTVNINEPVYGIDDLDSKISDSIDKGLAKHFNKNYAIGV